MIVAHGNGTENSDVSEARALLQVFGRDMPPVTAFKWAFGHLLAAAGLLEASSGLPHCVPAPCQASRHSTRSIRTASR